MESLQADTRVGPQGEGAFEHGARGVACVNYKVWRLGSRGELGWMRQ